MQSQHYGMALIDRVLDVGWVIRHQLEMDAALRLENLELRARGGPEAIAVVEERAMTLGEEVARLKTELEESRSHICSLDDELLTLS